MLPPTALLFLSSAVFGLAGVSASPPPSRPTITSAPALLPRADPSIVTTIRTTAVFPNGVADAPRQIQDTLPLPCVEGCWYFISPYIGCFRKDTLNTNSTLDSCDTTCTQQYYDGLSACLNCVVANGDERPLGWTPENSLTEFTPSRPTTAVGGQAVSYPAAERRPRINLNEANGWLRNVTELCGGRGVTLTGQSSVTASPTTTGPYSASFTSGQTITRTQWTGIAQYSPPMITYTQTYPYFAQGAGSSVMSMPGMWLVGGVVSGVLMACGMV